MINNNNQSVFIDEISETELENRIASAKGELGAIPELNKHAETIAILFRRYRKLLNKEHLLNASLDELD